MSEERDFQAIARSAREASFVEELWILLREHKKYWMIPVLVVLLLFAVLVVLSGSAAAPFIYTLF
jgi:Family of unknown function (DUF5989)